MNVPAAEPGSPGRERPSDSGTGNPNRRAFLIGSAALAAAAAVVPTGGARAAEVKLEALAGECIETGEACIAHCLQMFAAGDSTLAACARSVSEMIPVCRALGSLAALDSKRLPEFAAACRAICKDCEDECRKHAEVHAECKACADACAALMRALPTA